MGDVLTEVVPTGGGDDAGLLSGFDKPKLSDIL